MTSTEQLNDLYDRWDDDEPYGRCHCHSHIGAGDVVEHDVTDHHSPEVGQ